MKVHYPFGGPKFMLQWWSYDDQCHIILADTEQKVKLIANRVFKENARSAEIRNYFKIDIVAPSIRLSKLDEEWTLRENIENFNREIMCRLRQAVDEGKALPKQFAVCSEYRCDYRDSNDDSKDEDHFGCQNCIAKIRLVSMTRGDFYAAYSDKWNKNHSVYTDKRVVSRAEAAKDDEPLHYAKADFGHHQHGVALQEVKLDIDDEYSEFAARPSCISADVLFYYREVCKLDKTELQTMLDKVSSDAAKEDEIIDQKRKEDRNQEEQEQITEVLEFFS